MQKEKILQKFDELISEAESLEKERDLNIRTQGENLADPVVYSRLLCSAIVLFDLLQANSHRKYFESFSFERFNPGVLRGILESGKREFLSGFLNKGKILATADSFEGLLEQAEYLLEQDFKDAACVIIGGVLEGTLRSMLEINHPEIHFDPKGGMKNKNKKLHEEASAYDAATFKLIEGYAELRNSAAHGKYNEFDSSRVKQFVVFVRDFISRWYAPVVI
jgi:hypothetical protein